jgi:hypothetical protein
MIASLISRREHKTECKELCQGFPEINLVLISSKMQSDLLPSKPIIFFNFTTF